MVCTHLVAPHDGPMTNVDRVRAVVALHSCNGQLHKNDMNIVSYRINLQLDREARFYTKCSLRYQRDDQKC